MRVATVDGAEITYHRVGGGPPIVLAHSAGSDGREWRAQLAGLASELTVVAWDEPGAGGSSELRPSAGLAEYGDAFAGLVKTLDLAPAYLGGLSWGGMVALEAYRRHPEICSGLILADTYAGWRGSLPAEEIAARREGIRAIQAGGAAAGTVPTTPGLWGHDPDSAVVAELARIEADARPERFLPMVEMVAEADLSDLLPEIAVPTLLLWGSDDVRSPVGTVGRQFHEAIPGAELVVLAGAGHMSSMERPEEFNRAVLDFIQRTG